MTDRVYWKSTLTPEDLQKGTDLGATPALPPLPDTAFNPDGRYFISYRSVDGRKLADEFQTRLRAAGLSAWRDDADLPLGPIKTRLLQALDGTGPFSSSWRGRRGGLAGAILIATPQVWTSAPVRHIEAPRLLELNAAHLNDGFYLAVANDVPSEQGGAADMDQADDVYGIDPKALGGLLMADVTTLDGRQKIVRHLQDKWVHHRLEHLREGAPFQIDVDSRLPLTHTNQPTKLNGDDDLMIRLHQASDHRWPHPKALRAFADAMNDLKAMIPDGVAIQFRGRIHPTIALALGATFSARRPGQVIDCQHERGDVVSAWRSDAPAPAEPRTFTERRIPVDPGSEDKILVMLVATCTPADRRAFDRLARGSDFGAVYKIELDSWDPIAGDEGDDLARRLAARLSALASDGELHLAFVGPWALALLLAHHMSTTNYVTYEWDNEVSPPIYQPCLRINPGAAHHLTVLMPTKEDVQ